MDVVIVKLGSSVVVQEDGDLDYTRLANLVRDVVTVEESDRKVVLVTSGAVSAGRFKRLVLRGVPRRQRDQLYASVGQPRLLNFYEHVFARHGRSVAQLLLSREAFASRNQYFSIRDTMRSLLANDIVPIVNDNDVLHQRTEGFSDNDQLAACIAGMLNAAQAIFLTTPPGVLRATTTESDIVKDVVDSEGFEELASMIKGGSTGRGGMRSKVKACRLLFDLGIPSAISSGKVESPISSVLNEVASCTRFLPQQTRKLTGVRKWLCTGAIPRGTIYVSKHGGEKLTESVQRGSLLASGVMGIKGDFAEGDVVCVCAEEGALLGYGISRLSSKDISASMREERVIVVHADYFYGTAFGFFE